MAENTTTVFELGSKDLKAGYVYGWPTEEEPRLVTPAAATIGDDKDIVRPIIRGEIVNWDALESLIHYALYQQLTWVEGGEGSLLMVEPSLTSRKDRELLTQMMFEIFNVTSYFATDSAVASLAAVGKLNGIVVDVGYEKIDVVPVLEGLLQASAATRLPIGGRDITGYMQRYVKDKKGVDVAFKDAERMKRVTLDLLNNNNNNNNSTNNNNNNNNDNDDSMGNNTNSSTQYTLPDGQSITLDQQDAQTLAQAILNPSLLMEGFHLPTLAETIRTAGLVTTLHGEKEARKLLTDNIFLCGGGAGAPGLAQSVLSEVTALSHPSLPPSLCVIPEYMHKYTAQRAAWTGGAVIAKAVFGGIGPQQLQQPVTKGEYDEYGPSVIHRKCS